jgi:putative ABC transport system substrate-binding protein
VITRRDFLGTLWLGALSAPLPSLAQKLPAKVPRIGYLLLSPLTDKPSPERAAFLKGLHELGYVEGKNIVIEYRTADWDHEQLPQVAGEFAKNRVDLMFAPTEEMGIPAKRASKTIPIVIGAMLDPTGDGLVSGLARPGGNVTGLSAQTPELAGKRLQLLIEVLPKLKRVALLIDSNYATGKIERITSEKSARGLGVALRSLEVAKAEDYVKVFAAMTKDRPDALMAVPNTRMSAYRKIIAEFAEKNRLPTMFDFAEYVEAGGLMSYGPNIPDLFRRAATYVDKILKGAKPGDLPIEQPTTFELVINMKTAKTLGITIPQQLLLRADRVIE